MERTPQVRPRSRSERGYTLLEILIVLAILTLIASIVWQAMASYARWQEYQRAVATVRTGLETARTNTLGSVGDTIYGLYVGYDTVEFFSGPVPTPGAAGNTIVPFAASFSATTTLRSGAAEPWYVTFDRVTGAPSATGTIRIHYAYSDASTTLQIHPSGLVE